MSEATSRIGTSPPRVDWVDHAKGICIVLVVMMHSTLGLGEAIGREGWLHAVVAFARPFRMPDFFLISGLFLASAMAKPLLTYLDRKLVHFVYFYLLWTAIQMAARAPSYAALPAPDLLREIALVAIEPFGTLWFLYLLAVFFVVTRALRVVPAPLLLGVAAALEIAQLHSDWTVPHEFTRRWVYFLVGWLYAAEIFALAAAAVARPWRALAFLAVWAVVNGAAVHAGVAGLPWVSLGLGLLGAVAVVVISALLARLAMADWLKLLGRKTLVVYLAFSIPMAATRVLLTKTGLLGLDVGTASALITVVAIVLPLVLALAVTGTRASFLFERPAWARLGRSRADQRAAVGAVAAGASGPAKASSS